MTSNGCCGELQSVGVKFTPVEVWEGDYLPREEEVMENPIDTWITGKGRIITDLYQGKALEEPFVNFLIADNKRHIIRIQVYGCTIERFEEVFGSWGVKGRSVQFQGFMSGTYQEKVTVVCSLDRLRMADLL